MDFNEDSRDGDSRLFGQRYFPKLCQHQLVGGRRKVMMDAETVCSCYRHSIRMKY